jgi:hypothetical protein
MQVFNQALATHNPYLPSSPSPKTAAQSPEMPSGRRTCRDKSTDVAFCTYVGTGTGAKRAFGSDSIEAERIGWFTPPRETIACEAGNLTSVCVRRLEETTE